MSKCILLQSNFHGLTDTYLVCLQQIRIHGRGILRPPVRVVDEPLDADTVAPIEGQAHLENAVAAKEFIQFLLTLCGRHNGKNKSLFLHD